MQPKKQIYRTSLKHLVAQDDTIIRENIKQGGECDEVFFIIYDIVGNICGWVL